MISPLVINIRCVCIEEFVEMKKIHETYKKQKIEGEITSAYVGADRKLYGLDKNLDKMLDKVYGNGARPIITERIAKESPLPEPVLVADTTPAPLTIDEAMASVEYDEEKLVSEEGADYGFGTADNNCEG